MIYIISIDNNIYQKKNSNTLYMTFNLLFLIFIILIFIYYHIFIFNSLTNETKLTEQFKLVDNESCENVLYREGNLLYLKNTKEPDVPGVNPKVFADYSEYKKYTRYQLSKGKRCPVLVIQNIETTQGNTSKKVYVTDNKTHTMPGLPFINNEVEIERDLVSASLETNPNSYPGSDHTRFDNGVDTPLDKMYNSKDSKSPNAMDTNWGGITFSNKEVKLGHVIR